MATRMQQPLGVGRDDRFFVVSAFVMAVVIISGFSMQAVLGRSSFVAPLIVHVHAVVFMGWVALYVTQALLAARGARALHRRLGWIATGWMAAMVILGIALTVAMVRRGHTPFFFQPGYFLVMNVLGITTFAGLTGAAIVRRRSTAWHRRLHFCGMAVLLGPAFGRLLPMPLLIPRAGEAVFVAIVAFPLAGMIADLRRTGHIHPAWWWGLGTIVAMQIAMNVLPFSAPGLAIYDAVVAGAPGAAVAPLDFPPAPTGPLITGRPGAI